MTAQDRPGRHHRRAHAGPDHRVPVGRDGARSDCCCPAVRCRARHDMAGALAAPWLRGQPCGLDEGNRCGGSHGTDRPARGDAGRRQRLVRRCLERRRRRAPGMGDVPHDRAPPAHRAQLGSQRQRVIAGLSMGGLGAMDYAARHPGMFKAAASYSGVLDTTGQELFDGVAAFGDPVHRLRTGKPTTRSTSRQRSRASRCTCPTAMVGPVRSTPRATTARDGSSGSRRRTRPSSHAWRSSDPGHGRCLRAGHARMALLGPRLARLAADAPRGARGLVRAAAVAGLASPAGRLATTAWRSAVIATSCRAASGRTRPVGRGEDIGGLVSSIVAPRPDQAATADTLGGRGGSSWTC